MPGRPARTRDATDLAVLSAFAFRQATRSGGSFATDRAGDSDIPVAELRRFSDVIADDDGGDRRKRRSARRCRRHRPEPYRPRGLARTLVSMGAAVAPRVVRVGGLRRVDHRSPRNS
jgi:hypothetical protein